MVYLIYITNKTCWDILSDNTYSHTAYCRVLLIDLYLYIPNFVQIEKKLCGRGTDVRVGGRTYWDQLYLVDLEDWRSRPKTLSSSRTYLTTTNLSSRIPLQYFFGFMLLLVKREQLVRIARQSFLFKHYHWTPTWWRSWDPIKKHFWCHSTTHINGKLFSHAYEKTTTYLTTFQQL